jgi:arylsulfatase
MIRWPGKIKAGQLSNEIFAGEDWMPTLLAAAGVPDVKEKLLAGYQAGAKTFKVHLDGYNQLPYLTGQAKESARKEFYYFNDDGDLAAFRYGRWKSLQDPDNHGSSLGGEDAPRACYRSPGRPIRARATRFRTVS